MERWETLWDHMNVIKDEDPLRIGGRFRDAMVVLRVDADGAGCTRGSYGGERASWGSG
jgi:hypothetical protein